MNGAESLVHTLIGSGVDVCFSNPGTSEMHFVAALDRIPGMRCVLGLQENVVTGMADGYWRMAEKPACTLLHCGPGLANGLANLHNARRARSGIVNITGDHATYHRPYDAPLTADTAWNDGGVVAAALPVPSVPEADPHAIRNAARILREKKNVLILLGGPSLREGAQLHAYRIAQATGARLLAEGSNGRTQRGRGRIALERVPYYVDQAVDALKWVEHLILVNAKAPVGFFGYPGKPSLHYPPNAEVHVLTRYEHNAEVALAALAEELNAPAIAIPDRGPRPEVVRGAPTPEGLARVLGALMPEGAIIADESVSYGRGFFPETHNAPPHDWLQITGGAIGCGMPLATGAAVGGGGRRVINMQADGSAMYTVQSLWTQAREKLPVTTVIISNRKYAILLGEYRNVGANPGRTAMDMMDLGNPDIGWVKMAESMGVEAAQATTLDQVADLMSQSFARPGPFLIELVV
jgi:acetolactate synthase-1/2/3 large subunit